jgi:hypothetical protein
VPSLLTDLRRHSQLVVFSLGVVLVCVAGVLAFYNHPYLSGTVASIGASLIAAASVVWLSPLNEETYKKFLSLGIIDVYTSRSDVENAQWVRWLDQAKRTCTLLGIAHGNWCRDPGFPEVLENRLRNKVMTKIFSSTQTARPQRYGRVRTIRGTPYEQSGTRSDLRGNCGRNSVERSQN